MNVLKDAQVFQAHRQGQKVEVDDLRLAIQSRVNNSFTQPPPRELMLELAADRNNQPLSIVPKRYGKKRTATNETSRERTKLCACDVALCY